MSVTRLDGSVISSSQLEADEWQVDQNTPIMLGIILDVKPSDHRANYTALNAGDFRGYQHEARVLATSSTENQPDVIISHVVIPPGRHSGLDNYEEDLPRGVSGTVDGSLFNDDLAKVDYSKLDGEWCLVGFIGGRIDEAVIIGWWPHPSNKFDLATGNDPKLSDGSVTTLAQYDKNSGKSRFIRRLNGTVLAINKQGSVYLDTSEANSSVKIVNGKYTRTLVDKGGHVQVDLCQKAQLEINWNDKEHKNPRIGAGSTAASPVTDVDLPHPDQPVSGGPKPRPTTRSYVRGKEYELFLKTSDLSVFCETTDDKDGEFLVQAQKGVTVAQQASGESAATVSIRDGKIQVVAKGGSQINVLDDEIQILNSGGSFISLKGSVATVSAATINAAGALSVSGAMSVSSGSASDLPEPPVKGTVFLSQLSTLLGLIKAYAIATKASWAAVTPAQPASVSAAQAVETAIDTFLGQLSSFVSTTTKVV